MSFKLIIFATLLVCYNSSFSSLIDPTTLQLVSITENETIVFYELNVSSNSLQPNSQAHTFGIYINNTLTQKLTIRGNNLKNLQKLENSQLITGTYTTIYTTYPNSILSVWNVNNYSLETSIQVQANIQDEIDVWTAQLFSNQNYLFVANSLITNNSNYTQLQVYNLLTGDSVFAMNDEQIWMCKGVATTSSMIAYIGLQVIQSTQNSEFISLTSFAYDQSNYIYLGLTLSNDTFQIYNQTGKNFITNISLSFSQINQSYAQCSAIKTTGILFSCFKQGDQKIYIYQGILPILIYTVTEAVPIYSYDTLFNSQAQQIIITYATSQDIKQVEVSLVYE